jgi:hypothetical protein
MMNYGSMHFDGSRSNEDNGAGIILVSPAGKIHNLSYRLDFLARTMPLNSKLCC